MALNQSVLKNAIIQKVKNRLSEDEQTLFERNRAAFEPMIEAISEAVIEHILSSLQVIVTPISPGAIIVTTAGTAIAQTGANTNPITMSTRVL